MSFWITPNKEDIELSPDGEELEIFIGTDPGGNKYVNIPVEYIRELLE